MSGGEDKNCLLYLRNECNDISEIYLCNKYPGQCKNRHLINKRQPDRVTHVNNPYSFTGYSIKIIDVIKYR